jgi:hypothetical protein
MPTSRILLQLVAFLVIVSSFTLALAAIPPTLNYQGYLTDDSDAPVDGSVAITFRIYDAQTTTTPLWTGSQTVTVNQGVFSVELGSSSNPFPLHLFDNPLWLGLTVDADSEMTPRRAITTTAFAYKAQDADMLDGSNASAYDQSAHLIDTGNPHGITPSQIGAAAEGALSAHTGNTANPHNVTAEQVGAATPTDILLHAGNVAAHHFPYSDFAAVNAMGAKNDGNPLNHDRYTDGEVVTAMLANDGAGSSLDSDRVDGLEASELIDAAQDEVRTPINSLPYTISQPGSYYLTANLDGSSGGIDINADDVTIDFMGFTIDGGGVDDFGVTLYARDNVTIQNGRLKNFGRAGIYQSSINGENTNILNMHIINTGTLGTEYMHSGIYLISKVSRIEGCTIMNSGSRGISSYTSSVIANNIVQNSGTIGIIPGSGSSVVNNNVSYSYNWGIHGTTGTLIKDNVLYANNESNDPAYGGMLVYYKGKITGNILHLNKQHNIYVLGFDNTIENNDVIESTNGITFNASGNFYGNNRASSNTTDYNLGTTSQTTSVYLPNISY